MNIKRWLLAGVVVSILFVVPVIAGEQSAYAPPKASAEFERVKALAGKWEGKIKHSNGNEEPAAVEYRVTSGGSVVVETLSPGTSHEMISVYHDKGGKLSMTHYCMLGNQPTLDLTSGDMTHLNFESSSQTRKELAGQMYMNTLVLDRSTNDQLIQTWTAIGPDGKPADSSVFSLKKTA